MEHLPRFLAICEDARTRIKETDVETVSMQLLRKERFLLVDTREDSEWVKGRLPHAVHIGKGIIERDIEAMVADTSSEIVLYCGGGYRSALAADNLQKMGYTNVTSMAGGYRSWLMAGHEPVTKD